MNATSFRRRLSASVLAAGLAAGFLTLATAPTAMATTDVKQSRIAGADRYATAAAVAKAGFPTGSPTVVVASGRAFPDALAGSSLGLPVLLTDPSSLPSATSQAIKDLKATKVLILGGTAAVSDAVKKQIEATPTTTERVAGVDRYETAGAIAARYKTTDIAAYKGKKMAIIATGKDFADALAGGPLASSPSSGAFPVLLVNATVPPATKKAIADLGIKQVVILGGTAAVSSTVETELKTETGSDPVRLAGTNRFATATAIADAAIKDFGFAGKEALLANAFVFADALAGGPLGAIRGAPVLLTEQVRLTDEPKKWLAANSATVATVTGLGGPAAVSDSTLTAAEKAAETPSALRKNEKYVVTPTDRSDVGSGGTVSYTAQVGNDTVDIVLVKCGRVSTSSAGDTVFANTNTNSIADGTAKSGSPPDVTNTSAVISAINGTPTNPATATDYADAQKGSSGTLTFDVDGPGGTSSECIVPVVFNDADLGNSLNVPTTNPAAPSELFGTGGQAVYTPAEAAGGQFRVDVRNSDDAFNSFVGCALFDPDQPEPAPGTPCQPNGQSNFIYDSNDTFQVQDGTSLRPSNLAEFATFLTQGDDVRGSYAPNPTDPSQFILYSDEAPEAPQKAGSGATKDADGVHVTVLDSVRGSVDSYRLFRTKKDGTNPCPGTSPAISSTYLKVGDEVTDDDSGQYTLTDPLTDAFVEPDTMYCYTVGSVDDGDVGPGTAPDTAKTDAAASGAPAIIANGAKGKASTPFLAKDDVHELTFDKPLAANVLTGGSYKVTGTPSSDPETITCGTSATCTLSSDLKVLRVAIESASSPLIAYPLTITDLSGLGADTVGSVDKTIESNSLSGDTTRPAITAASFGSPSQSCSGFGQVGDVLNLTFGTETIALHVADANNVSQAELSAILGPDGNANPDLSYAGDTKITASVSGSVLTLTIVKATAHGVENGDQIHGTNNGYVTDAAGNPQQPGTATMPAADASC